MAAPTTNFETMEQRIKIKKKIRLISRIMHVCQNSNQFDYSNFAIAQKTSYTKATFGEWIGFWKNKQPQNFEYETWYLLEITIWANRS